MTVTYPQWLYSDLGPPQLVTSATQQATLPGDYAVTPSQNAQVLPNVGLPTVPTVVTVLAHVAMTAAPVVVKSKKRLNRESTE